MSFLIQAEVSIYSLYCLLPTKILQRTQDQDESREICKDDAIQVIANGRRRGYQPAGRYPICSDLGLQTSAAR